MENLAPSRLLKTRQGTIVVGVAAAVLAAILLLVYLSHYRSSVKGSTEPVTVLVAKRLIPKGTTGASIAAQNLFVVTTLPKGGLDGVVALPGDVFLVASGDGSAIYKGKLGGAFEIALSGQSGAADIGYDTKRGRVLVPRMLEHAVEAHDLK